MGAGMFWPAGMPIVPTGVVKNACVLGFNFFPPRAKLRKPVLYDFHKSASRPLTPVVPVGLAGAAYPRACITIRLPDVLDPMRAALRGCWDSIPVKEEVLMVNIESKWVERVEGSDEEK